jgi:hypothetical protein
MKFVLLSAVIYAPGTLLYFWACDAHRQGQRADRHERAHLASSDQPARGDPVP